MSLDWRMRRAKYKLNLSALYLPLYDELCASLDLSWGPTQGFRSKAEQDAIYAQGRTAPGKIVSNSPGGGYSPHEYGCASDWCKFNGRGEPYWPEDPRDWEPYRQALQKIGLHWGGSFSHADMPHNEVAIKCAWSEVRKILLISGDEGAKAYIAQSHREFMRNA